ncbi:MAG TPA: hypothetical protein VMX17_13890 [Candidatus Glassbacteria bacterium]|nr:hypothetical protein [Candidatus Glassbacteria bacterium]
MINLKLVAYLMVYESDLSKPAKLQLVNFLKEATEPQIKLFVVEGRVGNVSQKQELELDSILEVAPIAAYYASGIVWGAAIALAMKAFNKYHGEAAKACAEKRGREKKLCMNVYTVRAYQQKITVLKTEAGKCNQTADPKKCREKFIKNIKVVEKQLIKIRSKMF